MNNKDSVNNIQSIINYFETLTEASVTRLHEYYTVDAYFKDPFNEVRGIQHIQHIFAHMYTALDKPRFIITSKIIEDNTCFLVWDFKFYMKKYDKTKEQTIRGGSHLVLNAEGKIVSHRDYWDAAEELYEKLPVVGALMRWLKKQANS
jgi:predicted heme/steroid binding protein